MRIYVKILVILGISLSILGLLSTASAASSNDIFIVKQKPTNPKQNRTIKLIETYYSALNSKDMKVLFAIMDPNVTHDINQGPSEQGIDKFKQFMENANRSFDEKLSNIIILVSDDGKYASARWIDHGIYFKTYPDMGIAASNQIFTVPGGHFFEIRNGKLSRVTTFYNNNDFKTQLKK